MGERKGYITMHQGRRGKKREKYIIDMHIVMPFECCLWGMNYHSVLATSSSLLATVGALFTCISAKDLLVDSGCVSHELSSTLLCVGFANSSCSPNTVIWPNS